MNILVVDDESVIRAGLTRILEGQGAVVLTANNGQSAIDLLKQTAFDLVITDLKMPGLSGFEVLDCVKRLQPQTPVIMITGFATVETAVAAMKGGTVDYIVKPFTPQQILEKVQWALEFKGRSLQEASITKELAAHHGFGEFVGESLEMRRVYHRILQVASTDATVLITGESGTGKELAARAIHGNSARSNGPFMAINCTALVEDLLESELFGHRKGAYTGAHQTTTGLFVVADGGTLFLDEIGNLSLATQAKLLRVLQERRVTPIGGTQSIPFNVRLVVASNRDLKAMVALGQFREDLFFRLNIIPMELPPLRSRQGDLPLLVGHFFNRFVAALGKDLQGISKEAMRLLLGYSFPGNVRELLNVMERAVVLAEGTTILAGDLELGEPGEILADLDGFVPTNAEDLREMKRQIRDRSVERVERAFLLGALRRSHGNISRAAAETGMLRPNFQSMLKRLGISVKDYFDR